MPRIWRHCTRFLMTGTGRTTNTSWLREISAARCTVVLALRLVGHADRNLERNGVQLMNRRLEQARRLLALAQTGLHYSTGPFDIERYREIANIAHAQLGEIADMNAQEVAELFSREEGYANPK